MPGIVKAFRRPPADRLPDRNGGFPRLSGCVAHGLRCPASLRHALLAESLGKPSLWVIISAPWYYSLKNKLQTTADAAVLAAASEFPDTVEVRKAAVQYARINMPVALHGKVLDDDDVVTGN